jgi:outer membrane receptor for ferrienterochelin and colicin
MLKKNTGLSVFIGKKGITVLRKVLYSFTLLFIATIAKAQYGEIYGVIVEKSTGELLAGVNVAVENLVLGTVSDIGGNYNLKIPAGNYNVKFSFISYNSIETEINVENGKRIEINAAMEEASTGLEEVVVSAVRRMNSEVSMISAMKFSSFVVSGVSAQQITKTQDRDASEVLKRVPGISIIDNRFIISRGLAQRYNNVWINNNAVPSSEADARAFSFDMIPSGQIENIMIVKSPAPELPADFTGGFVKISTKSTLDENSLQVSYGININTTTHFRDFKYSKGSATDFLGFDNGFRDMRNVVPSFRFDRSDPELTTNVTANGFNNNWKIYSTQPVADQRFSLMLNRFKKLQNGGRIGVIAALNYSYSYLSYKNMTNSRFGIYDKINDHPLYLYKYEDDQYSMTARTGGMLNIIWMLSEKHKVEFRNILNQQGRNRYTYRDGWQNISSRYEQLNEEYNYNSRGAYTGQLSGLHTFSKTSKLDWTIGYSYANKNQPDRRQIERQGDEGNYSMLPVIRDFIRLDENTISAGLNYDHIFAFGTFAPSLKAGVYAETRSREYGTRYFLYRTNLSNLPSDFLFRQDITTIMLPEYFAADKYYISDASDRTFDYEGNNTLTCGYLGINLPVGKFNVYAGARYENSLMSLTNFITINTDETETYDYKSADLFPSVNATYNINKTNLLRFAYGKSIDRPEFREVSPSTHYDFDLFSFVRGNKKLEHAYVQNFDFRYEIYPSIAEMISFALFYKQFTNPIEWTYLEAGGTYTYTYMNADMADCYGFELDIKKNLSFIGLKDFTLSFNGALIRSDVKFNEESMEHDRPMQGQSPFIVNTGLFYQRDRFNAGLMYNIIGKRIVGIGRVDASEGGSIDNNVPDMYEMPRHAIDVSLSYKFGKYFEIIAGIRDLLATPVTYKQFPEFIDSNGNIQKREQTTKEYKPGQNFSIAIKISL